MYYICKRPFGRVMCYTSPPEEEVALEVLNLPEGDGPLYLDPSNHLYRKSPGLSPNDPFPDKTGEYIEQLQGENKLLKAQLQAQTERSDFIEDCIAEMATQVYGGV